MSTPCVVRDFGCQPYAHVQEEMEQWAQSARSSEIWVGEHPLVVSRGVRAHRDKGPWPFPSVRSSRGGLLTLHLPGQLVLYPLCRMGSSWDLNHFVFVLEETVINYLNQWGIAAYRCAGLHGVYTRFGKISSLGLRVRRSAVIHGLSLNLCCSLLPFQQIVSCGQNQIPVTNLAAHGIFPMISSVKKELVALFLNTLSS